MPYLKRGEISNRSRFDWNIFLDSQNLFVTNWKKKKRLRKTIHRFYSSWVLENHIGYKNGGKTGTTTELFAESFFDRIYLSHACIIEIISYPTWYPKRRYAPHGPLCKIRHDVRLFFFIIFIIIINIQLLVVLEFIYNYNNVKTFFFFFRSIISNIIV